MENQLRTTFICLRSSPLPYFISVSIKRVNPRFAGPPPDGEDELSERSPSQSEVIQFFQFLLLQLTRLFSQRGMMIYFTLRASPDLL